MSKHILEFNSPNEDEAVLFVSADSLKPYERKEVVDELREFGFEFTFIDADSVRAELPGSRRNVFKTIDELTEKGWDWV